VYPIAAGVVVESKQIVEQLMRSFEALSVRVVFETSEIPADWMTFLDRIERLRPDVIMLEVETLREPLDRVVQRIRSTPAQPAVFALNTNSDSDSILTALRAGVAEYLYAPFDAPLKTALERFSQRRERAGEIRKIGGKTVGFLSAKGGCGATTIACHVAAEMARLGAGRILLADLDLQSGIIGFLSKAKNTYTVADAVRNLQRLDQSFWKGLISNGLPNLEIITAPSSPHAKEVGVAQLKQVLSFARTQYDWSVLDLGRNINAATLSLLSLVDETYLVTTQEVPSLFECKQIVQVLLESGYPQKSLRVLLNRNSKRSDVTVEDIEKILGASIFATISNDYQTLQEAFAEGRLVASSTKLGRSLHALTCQIGAITPKKRFTLFG
jgi:pilus assembly protein CpaE